MYLLGYILYRFCDYFFLQIYLKEAVLCTGCICGLSCTLDLSYDVSLYFDLLGGMSVQLI